MKDIPVWLPWIVVWVVLGLVVWGVIHGGSKLNPHDTDDGPGGMA